MSFLERKDFTVTKDEDENSKLNLEGRGFEIALTQKAYSWLEDRFLKPKPADLTGPALAPGSRPGIGASEGVIPSGEPRNTTGRTGEVRDEILSFF